MKNFNREIESTKKNPGNILELQSIISEIKDSLNRFNRLDTGKKTSELN